MISSNEILYLKNSLKDDLRVTLLPGMAQGQASPFLNTKVMVFNCNASNNEQRLGLALARFLTNSQQQLQAIIQTQSFIPSNQTVSIGRNLLPLESVLLQQSRTATSLTPDDLNQLSPLLEQGELIYQKVIAGQITTEEAIQQLTQLAFPDSQ